MTDCAGECPRCEPSAPTKGQIMDETTIMEENAHEEALPELPGACQVLACLRMGRVGCPARCVCVCPWPTSELDDLTWPVPGIPWNSDWLEFERELGSVVREADGVCDEVWWPTCSRKVHVN